MSQGDIVSWAQMHATPLNLASRQCGVWCRSPAPAGLPPSYNNTSSPGAPPSVAQRHALEHGAGWLALLGQGVGEDCSRKWAAAPGEARESSANVGTRSSEGKQRRRGDWRPPHCEPITAAAAAMEAAAAAQQPLPGSHRTAWRPAAPPGHPAAWQPAQLRRRSKQCL